MTVSASYAPDVYDGDGVTTVFNVTFRHDAAGDIRAKVYDAAGVLISPQPAYTALGDGTGGTVTFGAAPAAGEKVVLYRATTLLQPVNYQAGNFPSSVHEQAADRLTFMAQDAAAAAARTLRVAEHLPPVDMIGDVAEGATLVRTAAGFGEGPLATDLMATQAAAEAAATAAAASAVQADAAAAWAASQAQATGIALGYPLGDNYLPPGYVIMDEVPATPNPGSAISISWTTPYRLSGPATIELMCLASDVGFFAGHRADIFPHVSDHATHEGVSVHRRLGQVSVVIGTGGIRLFNTTTKQTALITPAKWGLAFKAPLLVKPGETIT